MEAGLPKIKKLYLAIPYTGIEEESFVIVNEVMAKLCKEGYLVFSPISMCHLPAKKHGMPTTHHFWIELNHSFIDWADAVMIIDLGGAMNHENLSRGQRLIKESKGVQDEIAYGTEKKKHILYHLYE